MNRARSIREGIVDIDGQPLRNFGSCSYLALEHHPALVGAARDAAAEWGTQFSISRAYLEHPLYEQLEDALGHMTCGQVLVAPTTTLAHFAALPVLIGDDDAVVIDQFAHASLHAAVQLLGGAHLETLRHGRLERLEERLAELGPKHARVWHVLDGLYSMRGDLPDFAELKALLHRHPMLHLYIDDAHATSWCGARGRGAALDALGGEERVVVALSLNKAFAAAGGALVLPRAELKWSIRRCGGPMLFSGPIQPPLLSAALASARLHLRPELDALQNEEMTRIDAALEALADAQIPLVSRARTPIFMVPFPSTELVFAAVRQLRQAGYYVCPSVFPAVPVNRAGIRFTITRHNDAHTIQRFVAHLRDAITQCAGPVQREPRGMLEHSTAG